MQIIGLIALVIVVILGIIYLPPLWSIIIVIAIVGGAIALASG